MAKTLAVKRIRTRVEFGDTAATLHGKVGVSGSSPLGSFGKKP